MKSLTTAQLKGQTDFLVVFYINYAYVHTVGFNEAIILCSVAI